MNRKMREHITDVLGSLNQNTTQINVSSWSPNDTIFNKEKFDEVLKDLEETKRKTVTEV